MKKILFYTDTPLLGGAENQMLLLAKNLPKEKYTITIACSNFKSLNPWCQQLMENGIQVQRLHVLGKHDPHHYLYIKKLLPKFDLLHLHAWNPASCRWALLAANKTPVIITEHDPFLLTGIKGWLKNNLTKRVHTIITASKAAREIVITQNPELATRTIVIPNGIDIEEWQAEAHLDSRMEYRRQHFNCKGQEKIILCVAELHERKGQKYLIEAVQKLVIEFPNLRLVFVGDGAERRHYERLAESLSGAVQFMGRRKEIAKLMAASDLFVLPSIREAFGLVILEATVSGVPIVASNIGGIAEIIENEKTGLLVEPKNSNALAIAISKILKNPTLASDLALKAQIRTKIEFDAKTMALKTAEAYDKVPL